MIAEMLNIVGLRVPRTLAARHGAKICQHLGLASDTALSDTRGHGSDDISDLGDLDDLGDLGDLGSLSPSDVQCLLRTEDELAACDGWQRLMPSPSPHYLDLMTSDLMTSVTRQDWLLCSWETQVGATSRQEARDRLRQLCREGRHLVH